MAKKSRKAKRNSRKSSPLFSKSDKYFFISALVLIAAGYVCLGLEPVNGILTRSVAPVFLVAGYGVLMPMAILRRGNHGT